MTHPPRDTSDAGGVLLLVEDDPDHAFLVQRRLREQLGSTLTVEQLGTAAGAIERTQKGDVRCVILDLSLPDASGLEAVTRLRDSAPTVPIVVLTGMDNDEVGRQALRLGAQDYLIKGQHGPDAVGRSVVFAIERTRRQALEQSQALLAEQLVDAQRLARLGSWEWDLTTGEVSWSAEMHDITGLTPDDIDNRAFEAYVALAPTSARTLLREMFTGWGPGRAPAVIDHQLTRTDGSDRWVQCRASMADDDRVVGTVQDITEQKVTEDALAHQALHDALTGLPNRALLLDRLERALADPRRALPVAVIFMDLDRFKWVNDSLSHSAGDQLLVEVARRLSSVLRPTDTLARFGGDEFVLVCEGLQSEQQVLDLVDRINGQLAVPFTLEGREVVVTSSLGLALAQPGEEADSESLLRDADTAMYWAKDKGRSRCEIFDQAMRQRASERLEVEHDLRQSLQAGHVVPWYQPVIDVRTGRVIGCEALARWNHPTRGLLTPDAFIPHAEETGLIVALGEAVLRAACLQVAAWNRARAAHEQMTLAVNVSSRQLASTELVDVVAEALHSSGLSPSHLTLEVTESVVMDDVIASGVVLNQLRDIGVRTAVDDFGTGYSSLAYLLSLPVDVLKIDRSFVQVLELDDGPAFAIVRAIVALASALGLGVLAEGVETDRQLELLEALGVELGQGFLWGRPVPADEATWAAPHALPLSLPRARPSLECQAPADAGRS